jgi:dTDP-4-dehydrorhamnose 3,5-epimerase
LIFSETKLKGCYVISPEPNGDSRGWFARTFCKEEFFKIGHQKEWVQLNHSVTFKKGSLRGMHYQLPPYSEIKMVKCIAGSIFDVVIDLRKDSPTYFQWFGEKLSAENKKMMYIPEGFAHGFQTLDDNCELIYHHTALYKAESEGGIRFNDEKINISWPLPVSEISERDKTHPMLNDDFKGISI